MSILNTPPPPGHAKVNLEQLVKADKQLWAELSRVYAGAGAVVAATAKGVPPFDEHIMRLRNDPRVTMFLLPLPSFARRSKSAQWEHLARLPLKGHLSRNPRKSSRPRRRRSETNQVLVGIDTVTKDGQNVCWSYNMESGKRS